MIQFVLYGLLCYATRIAMAECPPNVMELSAIPNLPPSGTDGDFTFYKFQHTGTGSSTTTSIQITQDIKSAEILIVAGGGGGGGGMHRNRGPGGGGAGRLLWIKGIDIQAGTTAVTVGAGGSPGATGGSGRGGNGMNSVFLGYTAAGGGGGGAATQDSNKWRHGSAGGSGGGGGDFGGNAGSASAVNSAQSFGNAGGKSVGAGWEVGGAGAGGGGAGGVGQNINGYTPGAGGIGMAINMNGTVQNYAQGGEGGMWGEYPETIAHMGHGGSGGRPHNIGYVGGSGVVILRYRSLCNLCSIGSSAPSDSTNAMDCRCNPGLTGPDGSLCIECVAGKYKSVSGDVACTDCAEGEYSAVVGADANVCQKCPPNSRSQSGTSERNGCLCDVGFSLADGQICTECPVGSYKDVIGNSACVVCLTGSNGESGASRCVLPENTHIVKVTNDYRAIFRSSDTAAAALLATAIAQDRVHTTLAYDSATREETMWQHLTAQTTQSCQDLIPLIAGIQDVQDQYVSMVELLKRKGPCAPGFTGYDLLQDPGDAIFKDSECVMTAVTAEDTGRDALMVVQRQYRHEGKVYSYAAQYLTPALVRQAFGNPSQNGAQMSFCNVRDREHSPAAIETALSRVGLWTVPQDVAATDAGIVVEMPQIQQSGVCS